MKIKNTFILIFSLTFSHCVAQLPSNTTESQVPTLPEEMLLKIIIPGINKAQTLYEAWQFLQQLALTSTQFAALTRDKTVIDALAEKVKNPQKELFNFVLAKRRGTNTAKMIIPALFQAGADVNKAEALDNTPLMWAARKGHLPVVQELIRAGADVNKDNKWGSTPLITAAYSGHLAIVQELIQKRAMINWQDRSGNTPLMWAALKGHSAVVKELLQAGAAIIDKKNKMGDSAFDLAKKPEIRRIIQEAQKKRAEIDQMKPHVFQQIKTIGTMQQEVVNLKRDYQIALRQKRNAEAQKNLQQLIEKGTGLKLQLDQFKKLMTQVTMNIADADGNTPLHKAVQTNNSKLVEWIFQFQPDLAKRKNNAGQTPVELAAGRPEVLKLFMKLR